MPSHSTRHQTRDGAENLPLNGTGFETDPGYPRWRCRLECQASSTYLAGFSSIVPTSSGSSDRSPGIAGTMTR